jgi:hypothetical protein
MPVERVLRHWTKRAAGRCSRGKGVPSANGGKEPRPPWRLGGEREEPITKGILREAVDEALVPVKCLPEPLTFERQFLL